VDSNRDAAGAEAPRADPVTQGFVTTTNKISQKLPLSLNWRSVPALAARLGRRLAKQIRRTFDTRTSSIAISLNSASPRSGGVTGLASTAVRRHPRRHRQDGGHGGVYEQMSHY
jgi:hypothetical protein